VFKKCNNHQKIILPWFGVNGEKS